MRNEKSKTGLAKWIAKWKATYSSCPEGVRTGSIASKETEEKEEKDIK